MSDAATDLAEALEDLAGRMGETCWALGLDPNDRKRLELRQVLCTFKADVQALADEALSLAFEE